MSTGAGEAPEVPEAQATPLVAAKRCRWRGSMALGRRRLCAWRWGSARGQWGEGGGRADTRGFVDPQASARGQLLGWVGHRQGPRTPCQRPEEPHSPHKGSFAGPQTGMSQLCPEHGATWWKPRSLPPACPPGRISQNQLSSSWCQHCCVQEDPIGEAILGAPGKGNCGCDDEGAGWQVRLPLSPSGGVGSPASALHMGAEGRAPDLLQVA